LQALALNAKQVMDSIIKVTADTRAAYPRCFGFEVENLPEDAGFPKQLAINPRPFRQASFIFCQHAEAERAVGSDILVTGQGTRCIPYISRNEPEKQEVRWAVFYLNPVELKG
jgi:hypothetical protein